LSARKDHAFLQAAEVLGSLSTCDRAAVGAIITREGRAISWGYNGAPPGLPHCEENNHGWADYAKERGYSHATDSLIETEGCRNSTHAEANAVAFAARQGISTEGGTCYMSVSPCATCARLLIAAGIVRVVHLTQYRDTEGIELLKQAFVQVQPALGIPDMTMLKEDDFD
jgi:dCMP deaminase